MASSDNAKSNQHVLKIHPAPLADLLSGAKTAEVRRNDRAFQVGDTVRLMEVNPETGNWTGAADHVRTISHIQTGYGLPEGMCVLSYAQAEQQGAQAGEVLFKSPEELEKALFDHGSVVTSRLVADRIFAALATQPAEWIDPRPLTGVGKYYDQGFADGVAEAKRLNAVRGAEHE